MQVSALRYLSLFVITLMLASCGGSSKKSVTDAPTFTLSYLASAGGNIDGEATQTVNQGESGTTVVAVANPGFVFSEWSDGNSVPARTDTNVTKSLSVTALFLEEDSGTPEPPEYWPTTSWQSASPELFGFAHGALDDLEDTALAELPGLTSLMIVRNGYVVHESYHSQDEGPEITADTKHNVWSVSKSVSSLTVGAAWQNGDVDSSSLDRTTNDFFADLMSDYSTDDKRRNIRFRDVLQMRSGLSWSEQNELILFTIFHIAMPDPTCPDDDTLTICSLLRRPITHNPGTVWNYNTFDSYLLSSFFYHLTEQPLGPYARTHLLTPMGIPFEEEDWSFWPPTETNTRYTFGGGLSQYRTQDMARVGLLVLHQGQWDGQQLVSPEWLSLALEPIGEGQVAQFDENGDQLPTSASTDISYGMQWWTRTGPSLTGLDSITARGLGGQYIMVFPELDLVVAATHAYELGEVAIDRTGGFVQFLESHVFSHIEN